jgi:hypothetical protein
MQAASRTLAEAVASVDARGDYTPERIADASRRAVQMNEVWIGRAIANPAETPERRKYCVLSTCVRDRDEILKRNI